MTNRYLTHQRLTQLDHALTDRERLVLATLDRVRLATALQLERLHFTDISRRRARQILTRMAEQRLVARLPRVVGGMRAGSSGYVYGLDRGGRWLVNQQRTRRPWSVGHAFMAHTLAVTELYVGLVETERTGAVRLASFTTEPRCWRSFAGSGGGRLTLKPDAYLITELDRFEDRWFIEVDRSTESTTTLARKCELYRRYYQTGTEQEHSGVFPRVLWVVRDAHRYDTLIEVLGRQPAGSWQLFGVTIASEAVNRIVQGATE